MQGSAIMTMIKVIIIKFSFFLKKLKKHFHYKGAAFSGGNKLKCEETCALLLLLKQQKWYIVQSINTKTNNEKQKTKVNNTFDQPMEYVANQE